MEDGQKYVLSQNSHLPKVLVSPLNVESIGNRKNVSRISSGGTSKSHCNVYQEKTEGIKSTNNLPEVRFNNGFQIFSSKGDKQSKMKNKSFSACDNTSKLRGSNSDSYCLRFIGRKQENSNKIKVTDKSVLTKKMSAVSTLIQSFNSRMRTNKRNTTQNVLKKTRNLIVYSNEKHTQVENLPNTSSNSSEITRKRIRKEDEMKSYKYNKRRPLEGACRRSSRESIPPMKLVRREFLKMYNKRLYRFYEEMKKLNRSLMVETWEDLQLPTEYKNKLLQRTNKTFESRKRLLRSKPLPVQSSLERPNENICSKRTCLRRGIKYQSSIV